MFKLVVRGVPIFFADVSTESEALAKLIHEDFRSITFIDVPPSGQLLLLLSTLRRPARKLILRDRHWDEYSSEFESEAVKYVNKYQSVTARNGSLSCTDLVYSGEIGDDEKAIVSNISLDGLLASLKAVGCYHPRIDVDSKILNGWIGGKLSTDTEILHEKFKAATCHEDVRLCFDEFTDSLQLDVTARITPSLFGVYHERRLD